MSGQCSGCGAVGGHCYCDVMPSSAKTVNEICELKNRLALALEALRLAPAELCCSGLSPMFGCYSDHEDTMHHTKDCEHYRALRARVMEGSK